MLRVVKGAASVFCCDMHLECGTGRPSLSCASLDQCHSKTNYFCCLYSQKSLLTFANGELITQVTDLESGKSEYLFETLISLHLQFRVCFYGGAPSIKLNPSGADGILPVHLLSFEWNNEPMIVFHVVRRACVKCNEYLFVVFDGLYIHNIISLLL